MTPKFHDVFSVRKRKIAEKPIEKIFVDYREKNSLVASELVKLGFEIGFMELKVGDYLVKNTAIERKTVLDFVGSMINRRLLKQLEELKQYENKLLVIEGIEEQELYNEENGNGVSANSVRGFLLSILLRHKIPIIFSKNEEDTAKFINLIAKKKNNELGIRATKKTLNKKEQMQFILEGFPGIGPKTAKKLLEKFGKLQNVLNAPQDELKKLIGKKAEIFMLLEENY